MTAGSMGEPARSAFIPGRIWELAAKRARSRRMTRLAETCKMIRDHGQPRSITTMSKATTAGSIQSRRASCSVKLSLLDRVEAKRRERAAEYNRLLSDVEAGFHTPCEPSWSRAVYHLYVVWTERSRRHDGAFGEGQHRHRDSLSDSVAPSAGLHIHGIQAGDFPAARRSPMKSSPCRCFHSSRPSSRPRVVRSS